jgi:PAS domain S-box-containing protein
VFHIVNEITREPCENPVEKVLRLGVVVGLANHTLLIARDGTERIIADSGAPIRPPDGRVLGVVLVFRDVTEKHQAEHAVRRERDRAQQYLDIASVILVAIGADQRVTLINKKGCETLEFSAEEIVGQNWFDLMVPQQDRERTRAAFVQLIQGEVEPAEYFENAVITRSGTERVIAWHNTLIRDESGRTIGTLSSGEDITERHRVEAALRESESVLRSFFDSPGMQRGIIEVVDGDILHISDNAGSAAFFNRSTESMRGKFESEMGVPDDVTRAWIDRCEESRRTNQPVTFEYWHQAGNETRSLLPTVSCIGTGPTGAPRFAYVVIDVTERKRAEEALRRSEALLKATLESTADGILAVNEAGAVVHRNARFAELWRIPREILDTGDDNQLLMFVLDQLEDPEAFLSKVRTLYQTTLEDFDELRFKDGRIFERFSCPLVREDRISGRVWSFRDITEQRRAEEEIRTLNEELQRGLLELRDTQDQLVKKERLAVLGQLAGGVGHELRNPLGVIKNAAFFLNMSLDDPAPQVKETLGILDAEVEAAEKIIASLLDYARPKPPISGVLHINEVIRAALSRLALPPNVELLVQLDEHLPPIRGDSGQLLQVFANLLANALQAMPGGGRLTIVTSRMSGPDRIAVSVADTGVGVARENLAKLFQPLFTTKITGIGLGLAITRSIVEAHRGAIDVQSEAGRGSTFIVTLPVVKGDI